MDKKELVKKFCSILQTFLDDMYRSYPDSSLLMLQQATNVMILTSPQSVLENFMLCIAQYSDKIKSRDESFFLDGGLESDLSTGDYSFLLDELKKISIIWKNPETPKQTKEAIWKYLQVLNKIGEKFQA